MAVPAIEELRDELNRLMIEQIESLKRQTFEVSADFILAMKRND